MKTRIDIGNNLRQYCHLVSLYQNPVKYFNQKFCLETQNYSTSLEVKMMFSVLQKINL